MKITIRSVGAYHPKTSVTNAFFLKHFQDQGKDIDHFLKHMGRKSRYMIQNETENGLTMGIEAAKDALKRAKLSGEAMDMIVFSTQVPEYTFPTNATFVHHAIHASSRTIIMDSNANCGGMTVAVDHACRYMLANPSVNQTLVVGSDYNTLVCDPNDEVTYANYGDAACAVILEKTEGESGFLGSSYYSETLENKDKIIFPSVGLSQALRKGENNRYLKWIPFDGGCALPPAYQNIQELLDVEHLQPTDVKAYCLSQFSLANILEIQNHFHLDDEQIIYIGDQYGYTGTSSPFLALYEGIKEQRINRGDYVIFWTVGAGFQTIGVLFNY
ncbi:3-oxoacyl-[acyl-carrier-protein] synthase III C-terminal domain-containing protein [Sporolactobacillus terrae]|uniref:3-oxoacyl-[acyl-carrier-protein] synthase III C-terminal domain-containing protein n=1 Tax=Sporolactobacillus terrae TaxID=269673 RepID=UPI000490B277|nr:3-oxoacyl-[acyl-carrier-protein] synthase III C-terminal domain-containing protein [Sporolactobacillus terrae]